MTPDGLGESCETRDRTWVSVVQSKHPTHSTTFPAPTAPQNTSFFKLLRSSFFSPRGLRTCCFFPSKGFCSVCNFNLATYFLRSFFLLSLSFQLWLIPLSLTAYSIHIQAYSIHIPHSIFNFPLQCWPHLLRLLVPTRQYPPLNAQNLIHYIRPETKITQVGLGKEAWGWSLI